MFIGTGDLKSFRESIKENKFKIIVGSYNQCGIYKEFYNITEYYINKNCRNFLIGEVPDNIINDFIDYVKAIPKGKKGQQDNKKIWQIKRNEIVNNYNCGILSINAKIDSKNQRRVQGSLDINKLKIRYF